MGRGSERSQASRDLGASAALRRTAGQASLLSGYRVRLSAPSSARLASGRAAMLGVDEVANEERGQLVGQAFVEGLAALVVADPLGGIDDQSCGSLEVGDTQDASVVLQERANVV